MPKIAASTVVEHRRQMNEKLLDATERLLADAQDSDTGMPLKVGTVAKEVGIARSSFYRYYDSVDELVAALVIRDFPRWKDVVAREVEAAASPVEKARAYTRSNIKLATDQEHSWRTAVFSYHFHEESLREIAALHAELHDILVAAIVEIPTIATNSGHLLAQTIQNLVNTAVTSVEKMKLDDASLRQYISWNEVAVEAIIKAASADSASASEAGLEPSLPLRG